MSNGAVKVKWTAKNKCVVHNFIVRKTWNWKSRYYFCRRERCVKMIFGKLDSLWYWSREYSDIRDCSSHSLLLDNHPTEPAIPGKSWKLLSKFFCNCRKQYLHSLANMFDIFFCSSSAEANLPEMAATFHERCLLENGNELFSVFYKRTMSKIRQPDQALVQKLVSLRLSLKRVLPTNNLRCLPIEAKWEVGNFDCLINENLT